MVAPPPKNCLPARPPVASHGNRPHVPPRFTRAHSSMFEKGLLGYAGNSNKNVIIAMQIETADSIKNMEEISAVDGVDMLFLGDYLFMYLIDRLALATCIMRILPLRCVYRPQ